MCDSEGIWKQNNPFIGIISSNYQRDNIKPFKKYISNYLSNKDGGIIFIPSKKSGTEILHTLEKTCKIDSEYFYKMGRLAFIDEEKYLVNNEIDNRRFLEAFEDELDKLDKSGSKEIIVYMIIDSLWEQSIEDSMQHYFNRLKDVAKEKRVRFIFKYIIEELSGGYIKFLLNIHTILLTDDNDDFKKYTPLELISQSLSIFSKQNSVHKKYEKEIIRNEYLQTLGEIMEGTVHDINNLLITILGYAQLSTLGGEHKEMEEYLRIIHKTALDGKSITDRIKNYIRGSYNSLKDIYELNDIINNCIDMIKYKFKSLSIKERKELKMVIDLNSFGKVYVNEYEIRQAILNIIFNGIDAMEDGGVLTIKTYNSEDQLVLEVIDTGKGMDEATKNKIFGSYFTTKGSYGTGLGLYIAKKAFDNCGANIYVESQLGKGTKFTIYFPAIDNIYNIAENKTNDYNYI